VSVARSGAAVAAGLLLATLPFWRYAPFASGRGPHTDHAPRHGGLLGMSGDHHLELICRAGDVHVFVSDAWRRPVRPQAAWIVFDASRTEPLRWAGDRLVGACDDGAREANAVALLEDGTRVSILFALP
jgi:hypothetical protein